MALTKEELRLKYAISDEDFDVVCNLALRPTCEHCNKPLPPDSVDAMICSFECTFCSNCVETVIGNVCPNCGGGFTPRPVRPKTNWKNGNHLGAYPARTVVKHKPVDPVWHRAFSAPIRLVPAHQR